VRRAYVAVAIVLSRAYVYMYILFIRYMAFSSRLMSGRDEYINSHDSTL
jgi:hypothetical protein